MFVGPDRADEVVAALSGLFTIPARDQFLNEIASRDQARTFWGDTPVDLFFSDTEFHVSMAERVREVDFGGTPITILSVEDIIVCKLIFNRDKDWWDIDAMLKLGRESIDLHYVRAWLAEFCDADDERFARLSALCD